MKQKILMLSLIVFCLASCARNREDFYFGNYSQAEHLFNKGQYEKAIQKYQAYIDENPEGNLAIISSYYIAKSHAMLGHADEAKAIYQKLIQEHPDLVWANFAETQLKELNTGKASETQPAQGKT